MAILGNYCKAYVLAQLEKFPGWQQRTGLGPYLYVQEDYTVTEGVYRDEKIVIGKVTPEWIEFCKQALRFEVPGYKLPLSKKIQ